MIVIQYPILIEFIITIIKKPSGFSLGFPTTNTVFFLLFEPLTIKKLQQILQENFSKKVKNGNNLLLAQRHHQGHKVFLYSVCRLTFQVGINSKFI